MDTIPVIVCALKIIHTFFLSGGQGIKTYYADEREQENLHD
jgi:hypothetical protein